MGGSESTMSILSDSLTTTTVGVAATAAAVGVVATAVPRRHGDKLDLPMLYRKTCSIDQTLDKDPDRKAPPIDPKNCVAGSVARGKDGHFYKLANGRWEKMNMSKEQIAGIEAKLKSPINGSSSNMKGYRKKPCPIDPKLAKVAGRMAPPIDPKKCSEETVAMGKNNVIYQISGGRWVKLLLEDADKKSFMGRLSAVSADKAKTIALVRRTKLSKPNDVAMLDAQMNIDDLAHKYGKMKTRSCHVDPVLYRGAGRKAPPIRPGTCKEGTIAMGRSKSTTAWNRAEIPYMIKNGKWIKVALSVAETKQVKTRLRERMKEATARTEAVKKKVLIKRKDATSPKKKKPKKKKLEKKKATTPKKKSEKKKKDTTPKKKLEKKKATTPKKKSEKKKKATTPKKKSEKK